MPPQRASFLDTVEGVDPEWIRLHTELEPVDRLHEIETLYVPRTIRAYEGYNKGPVITEFDIPPDGISEDELDGFLQEAGWPAKRVQLKVYRGWTYLTSHSYFADPHAARASAHAHASVEEEGEDDDEGTDQPRSFGERLGAVIASEQGPDYIRQMISVVGPAAINLLAMYQKQTRLAYLEAEAEWRERQRQQLDAPHHAYQDRPVPAY